MESVKKEVKYTEIEKYSCLEFLRKNSVELYLNYCGKEVCPPSHTYGPASRQEYLLHYVIDGEGTLIANDTTYHFEKHDAFLIFPEEITTYTADSSHPRTYVWIAFDGIKAWECLEQAGFSKTKRIGHFHREAELIHCIETILASHELTYYNELIRESQFFSFLAILIQEYQESTEKSEENPVLPQQSYVDYAITFIENNYRKEITVQDICSHVGITRGYLTHIFQQSLHTSPYEYLLGIRINKSSSLLKTTSLPINQISLMVGYHDALAFSKIFKQKTGVSPRAFRSSSNTLVLSDKKDL